MTHPNTEHDHSELGGPPEYPTSQMMPPEYWRKEDSHGPGGSNHGQYMTIETPEGLVKRDVEPGWGKPVHFVTDLDDDGTEDA